MRSCSSFALAAAMVFGGLSVASAKPVASTNLNNCGVNDVTFRLVASQSCFGQYTSSNDDLALLNALPVFGGGWDTMVRDNGTASSETLQRCQLDPARRQHPDDRQLAVAAAGPGSRQSAHEHRLHGRAEGQQLVVGLSVLRPEVLCVRPHQQRDVLDLDCQRWSQTPGLSHMSLYFRNGTSFDCSPTDSEVRHSGSRLRGRRLPAGRARAGVDGTSRAQPARRGRGLATQEVTLALKRTGPYRRPVLSYLPQCPCVNRGVGPL